MKTPYLIPFAIAAAALQIAITNATDATAHEQDEEMIAALAFHDELNSLWDERDYEEVKLLIANREHTIPGDLMALGAKVFYLLYAEGKVGDAQQTAQQMLQIADGRNDDKCKAYLSEFLAAVLEANPEEVWNLTPEMRESLHSANGFPFSDQIASAWLMATRTE